MDGFKAHFEMLLYFFWVNFEAIFPFMLTSTDPPHKNGLPGIVYGSINLKIVFWALQTTYQLPSDWQSPNFFGVQANDNDKDFRIERS